MIPSNKRQINALFISAPASRPHIDPAFHSLFSRAPPPCPPPLSLTESVLSDTQNLQIAQI